MTEPVGWELERIVVCPAQNNHRQRLDSGRRSIGLLPGLEQGLQAEINVTERVHARVRGSHPGKRLRHVAEGVLHCARADGFRTGRDGPGAVTLRKQEDNRDGVGVDILQVGPNSVGGAELLPDAPRARG